MDHLYQDRFNKLAKIRELGVDPYPAKWGKIKERIADAREKKDGKATVAGRIMAIRGHGGSGFADVVDESGKIQLFFSEDQLENQYNLYKLLDTGDFIGVEGDLFTTQAGELTIKVAEFTLLTKSLRPLPSTWYGFKDIEERYRQRYLDLIINPEVKKIFNIRSTVVSAMREFLLQRGYIEVETPVLQPIYGGGLALPFKTYHNALGIPLYMRISTELYLKRLIVGGLEKVFEIARLFRNEGIDKNHNPEFTMLETMEAYADYQDNMKLVEEMTEFAVKKAIGKTEVKYGETIIDFAVPWKRMTMKEAVKQVTGIDFDAVVDLLTEAEKIGVKVEEYQKQSKGLILAKIFEEKVEKTLIQPTFIYDFPVETSPLAKKCAENSYFVQRFEHFVAGMEGSNNYSELNDPVDLTARFKNERKKEKLGDEEAHQTDDDFIEAMEYGMPPTSGIGPGIDRLVMIICAELGAQNLRDVILFPTMRPEILKRELREENKENLTQQIKQAPIVKKVTELPDEHSKRFVAVLNKKIEIGRLMNALGHMTAGLSGGSVSFEEMCFLQYQDKDGSVHPNISHFPFIVLSASNSNEIRQIRNEALQKGLIITDFTSTMTIGTSEEQQRATERTGESDLEYYGICLFGNTEEIKKITKKLSLFK